MGELIGEPPPAPLHSAIFKISRNDPAKSPITIMRAPKKLCAWHAPSHPALRMHNDREPHGLRTVLDDHSGLADPPLDGTKEGVAEALPGYVLAGFWGRDFGSHGGVVGRKISKFYEVAPDTPAHSPAG